MKKYGIILGLVCVLGASLLMAGCGKEEAVATVKETETKPETETEIEIESETEPETEEIVEEQVIGEATEDAYELLITNHMGQNIVGIAIKGITEEKYPENMLKTDEVLAFGDIARLYYSVPAEEDQETIKMETEAETDLPDEKLIKELYTVQLTLENETVIELTNFGFHDMDEVELCYEDEVGFVKYISKTTEEKISTKEMELAEKALNEVAETEANTETKHAKRKATSNSSTEAAPATVAEATPEPAPEVDQNVGGCLEDALINE